MGPALGLALDTLVIHFFLCRRSGDFDVSIFHAAGMCYFSNHSADISCDPGEKIEENIDISISAGRNFVSEEKIRLRPWTIRCMFVGAEENSLNY